MPYQHLFRETPEPEDGSRDPFGRDLRFPDPGWEQARTDWVRGIPLTQIVGADPFALQAGVGRGMANRRPDVFRVQALLHKEGYLDAEATGGPTGYWGRRDDEALRALQEDGRLAADGILLPGGETITALKNAYAGPARSPEIRYAQAGTASDAAAPAAWRDPWPDSPVHATFRRLLHERESRGRPDHGYDTGSDGAWGRYQMRRPALQDAGIMDAQGNWTGSGTDSEAAFRANPAAQEKAFAAFMAKTEQAVRRSAAALHIGRQIDGVKAVFPVTEAGLMAAAHRWGAGFLPAYFRFQQDNGWKSDYDNIPEAVDGMVQNLQARWPQRYDTETVLRSIETRLREFSGVPYRAGGGRAG